MSDNIRYEVENNYLSVVFGEVYPDANYENVSILRVPPKHNRVAIPDENNSKMIEIDLEQIAGHPDVKMKYNREMNLLLFSM